MPVPDDFDVAWTLRFLSARTVRSMERTDGLASYQRSIETEDGPLTLDLCYRAGTGRRTAATAATAPASSSMVSCLSVGAAPVLPGATVRRLVTRMFDLDADLLQFRRHVSCDPLLRRLVARAPGLRVPQFLNPFEGVVRAILGQQVSVAAATTMVDRVVRLAALRAPAFDGTSFLRFPPPEALLALGPARLAAAGITRNKAAALCGVAKAVVEGRIVWDRLRGAPAEEAQAMLLTLPGIGPWTASYIRMRALGDRDAFPAADLGLRKALGIDLSAGDIEARAKGWRPWRAYAALHLWNSLR